MISPNKRRIDISLPIKSIELLDKVRGNQTRSEFIDTAIYFIIASQCLNQQAKEIAPAKKG